MIRLVARPCEGVGPTMCASESASGRVNVDPIRADARYTPRSAHVRELTPQRAPLQNRTLQQYHRAKRNVEVNSEHQEYAEFFGSPVPQGRLGCGPDGHGTSSNNIRSSSGAPYRKLFDPPNGPRAMPWPLPPLAVDFTSNASVASGPSREPLPDLHLQDPRNLHRRQRGIAIRPAPQIAAVALDRPPAVAQARMIERDCRARPSTPHR